VATKVIGFMRKRGVIVLVISAISALLAAKTGGVHGGGVQPFGFWDGPA
jgi:hypothetical protein